MNHNKLTRHARRVLAAGLALGMAVPVPVMAVEAMADGPDVPMEAQATQTEYKKLSSVASWELPVCTDIDQAAARKALACINESRAAKGLAGLTWDTSLEETAIQHAVEWHLMPANSVRVDGSTTYQSMANLYETARILSPKLAAANVGRAQSAREAVDALLAGANNLECLMTSSAESVAFAKVMFPDGSTVWAAVTGVPSAWSAPSSGMVGDPEVGERTVYVEACADLQSDGNFDYELAVGGQDMTVEKGFLTLATPAVRYAFQRSLWNFGQDFNEVALDPSTFEWTSSDPSVAEVTSDGIVIAHKVGEATLTYRMPLKTLTGTWNDPLEPVGTLNVDVVRHERDLDDPFGIGEKYPEDYNHWVNTGEYGDAHWYIYRAGEIVRSSWIWHNNKWYYVGADGEMLTGMQKIREGSVDRWYYFNTDHDGTYGALRAGWVWHKGNWYYANPTHDGTYGELQSGWIRDASGRWYYMDYSTHAMVSNRWIGHWFVGKDGAWVEWM